MTFSQEPYQANISKNEPIGTRELAYFRQRFKHQVFGRLASKFAERAQSCGLSKSKVSTFLKKDAGQVNRLLSIPSNLTLDTLSDLALALGCEPEIAFLQFDDDPCHNFVHELMREKEEVTIDYNWNVISLSTTTRPISALVHHDAD